MGSIDLPPRPQLFYANREHTIERNQRIVSNFTRDRLLSTVGTGDKFHELLSDHLYFICVYESLGTLKFYQP